MSGMKHMAKFSPSPDLCSNCTRLLLSELKDAVLLHQSVVSLHLSSQSCSLCLLIWSGLTGHLRVKNGPRFLCKLDDLTETERGQTSEIWGRRHMVDFASLGMNLVDTTLYAWDIPISFIEVMMVKTDLAGHLAEKLRSPSAPESTTLNNAWWGVKCDPAVVREAGCCPYIWEYVQEVRDFWRRINGKNCVMSNEQSTPMYRNMFSSTRPRDVWWGKGVHRPYHRAVIQVSPLDHTPGLYVSQPSSETGDQRDGGVSGMLQRLSLEKGPITCGSPARLELAQRWWEDCLEWHLRCNHWSEGYSLPSRVINVGPEDGSQEPFLHVPDPSDIGLYVCLSHRWGGAKVLQTIMGDLPGTPNGRTGTFSEFQSAIPMESMPKTFQDAVQVTRALGFRYIWIDSLCIVQDRSSDWEAEAKKMGSYYRNAQLTLVAGSAVSADSGLFFPMTRPAVPCHVGSVSLELPGCRHHGAEPHPFQLFAREPQMARGEFRAGDKPTCALDERAWVLQEEVLSARSLIFTDEGLYWECIDLSASEFHPHGSEYQHTRSMSSRDPESYGGEVFLPTDRTCAQSFKTMLLDDLEFLDFSPELSPDAFFRSIGSMKFMAQDNAKLRSETAALRQARVQVPPPDSPQDSEDVQMATRPQTQSEKPQQNLKIDEEEDNLIASAPRLTSPQKAQESLDQEGFIRSQTHIWHLLVMDYSARHLTRESDRLIAIQGLVSMLSKVRKDRYYAGLWGRTLREDILWKTLDGRMRIEHLCDCMPRKVYYFKDMRPRRRLNEPETRQGVAPSWSWAAADQGVVFLSLTDTEDTLEYFFRPLGVALDDDTAVLNVQGRLTLEGVLRPIGLAVLDGKVPHDEHVVLDSPSCDEDQSWHSINSSGWLYDPSDPSKKEIGAWHPDRITSTSGVVVCVPLLMRPLAHEDGSIAQDIVGIHCLVLEPTENCRLRNKASKLLEFRRMGLATFNTKRRAFLGLGNSQRKKDGRPWDDRIKEWTRKPMVMDII